MIKKIIICVCIFTLLFSCVRRREGVPNSSSRHHYTQERDRTDITQEIRKQQDLLNLKHLILLITKC